jgi:hypothetical protein
MTKIAIKSTVSESLKNFRYENFGTKVVPAAEIFGAAGTPKTKSPARNRTGLWAEIIFQSNA